MRIVVTGSSGFVGVPVCRRLAAKGHDVLAVTRHVPSPHLPQFTQRALGDLTRQTRWDDILAGADAVVHLAGRAHVLDDDPDAAERLYQAANVDVLEGLAEAAVRNRIHRLVFVSTIKVCGEATASEPFNARSTPAPEDAYGKSKLKAEQVLKAIAGSKLQWVILRPPLMYGPRVRGNLERLFRYAERGWPMPFGLIKNARDVLSVEAFADLIVTVVGHPAARNRTFLARDGAAISTPDLYRAISRALDRPPRVIPLPLPILATAASMFGKTDEYRRLAGNLEIDDSDTRRSLGWAPSVNMEDALAETARWFKAR